MHAENLLEPWIALRLLLAAAAAALLGLASWPSLTALRRFDVTRSTEGQLLLERRFELATVAGALGAAALLGGLFVSCVAAAQIHTQIRGAMCAYGVFAAAPGGFRALTVDFVAALAGGVLWQMQRIDARLPRLSLVRPLARGTLLVGLLAVASLVYNAYFWLSLDRTVVASCCSLELDATQARLAGEERAAPWLVGALAGVAVLTTVASTAWASRRPSLRAVLAAGASSLLAAPLASVAVAELVAPHVFETPTHRCPFCLLRPDGYYLGYLLFGAILLATTRAVGVAVAAWLTQGEAAQGWLPTHARRPLGGAAWAWAVVLAGASAPVLSFVLSHEGRSLFP